MKIGEILAIQRQEQKKASIKTPTRRRGPRGVSTPAPRTPEQKARGKEYAREFARNWKPQTPETPKRKPGRPRIYTAEEARERKKASALRSQRKARIAKGLPVDVRKRRTPIEKLIREKAEMMERMDREIDAAREGVGIRGPKRRKVVRTVVQVAVPQFTLGCAEPDCKKEAAERSHFCAAHKNWVVVRAVSPEEQRSRIEEAMF